MTILTEKEYFYGQAQKTKSLNSRPKDGTLLTNTNPEASHEPKEFKPGENRPAKNPGAALFSGFAPALLCPDGLSDGRRLSGAPFLHG